MHTHVYLYVCVKIIVKDKEVINLKIGRHGKRSITVARSDWKGGQEEGKIK